MYGRSGALIIVRKRDGKMLALPVTPESWSLRNDIINRLSSVTADALASFVTDVKWETPRALALKPAEGENLYIA
jgi:hypothetical protein